jgi:hypothetical protein
MVVVHVVNVGPGGICLGEPGIQAQRLVELVEGALRVAAVSKLDAALIGVPGVGLGRVNGAATAGRREKK